MNDPHFHNGVLRLQRAYPHPIDRVWRAISTGEHLSRWFPSPVEIDLRPGGAMRFVAFEGDAAHGTVIEVDPPQKLAFDWGDRFEIELAPAGESTHLTFTQFVSDRAGAASFAAGWEMCLAALASLLDETPPAKPDRGVARHEELIGLFGLDQPEIDATGAMRFERQLTFPQDVAESRFGLLPDASRASFKPGTGHGARLVVELPGGDPPEIQRWHDAIEALARPD